MSRHSRYFIPNTDRKLGNRYELIECLGDGSYGWVWKAQRLDDNAIVAVKIPKAQGSKNSELAEGERLLNQPSHQNVVSVYWMGRVPPEREWYAIEMEYFPSHTLARLLDEGEQGFSSSYTKILSIYLQILEGVSYLHKLGMSHGDIKPQNILIAGDQPKLTDFGSSLLPEEMYTRTRENGGTILYSAPELAGITHRGQDRSQIFKGDIYSLGVLLYHLVTSRLPHDTLSQVVRHGPFPRPREINSTVCPVLEDFILRSLAHTPSERWQSVSEMLIAFTRVKKAQLDYQPIRLIPKEQSIKQDWSSQTVALLEEGEYLKAESVCSEEFQTSSDPYAFLMMVSAAFRDKRYFDCLKEIENCPEMLDDSSPITAALHRIALDCYLSTRQIQKAEPIVEWCLSHQSKTLQLLLKKVAILGLTAKYEEASDVLLQLNRDYPKHPIILKRLVHVFELRRDIGKAAAFLRAYSKLVPDDPWSHQKLEKFVNLKL